MKAYHALDSPEATACLFEMVGVALQSRSNNPTVRSYVQQIKFICAMAKKQAKKYSATFK